MSVWFLFCQSWLNPFTCGDGGAHWPSQRLVNWNLGATSETWWRLLSLLVFTHQCLNSFSLPLSAPFFQIRWDFIEPPLSVTTIGCEISDGRACGNHSISCAHLAQHLYRHAGGFWKGEKSFTKSISETGLTQTVSRNTFIPYSPFFFLSSSLSRSCLLYTPTPLACTDSLQVQVI